MPCRGRLGARVAVGLHMEAKGIPIVLGFYIWRQAHMRFPKVAPLEDSTRSQKVARKSSGGDCLEAWGTSMLFLLVPF